MNADDRALVEACAKGDSASWDRFLEQYGRLIGATIGAVGNRQASWQLDEEDMKSHIYEKLLEDDARRLTAWRGDSKLSTYLVQVSRNLCIDYLRKSTRGPRQDVFAEIEDVEAEPEVAKLADGESLDAQIATLQAAIENLSPKQGMIIKLRLAGVPLRDIAGQLRIPKGTVFAESSRAMKRLRSLLEGQEPFAERGFTT
jgi:RNA polymerase sigma factor (sigma-70 family)